MAASFLLLRGRLAGDGGQHRWQNLNPMYYGPNPKVMCRRCRSVVFLSGGAAEHRVRVAGRHGVYDLPGPIPGTCSEMTDLLAVLEVMDS